MKMRTMQSIFIIMFLFQVASASFADNRFEIPKSQDYYLDDAPTLERDEILDTLFGIPYNPHWVDCSVRATYLEWALESFTDLDVSFCHKDIEDSNENHLYLKVIDGDEIYYLDATNDYGDWIIQNGDYRWDSFYDIGYSEYPNFYTLYLAMAAMPCYTEQRVTQEICWWTYPVVKERYQKLLLELV